MTANDLALSGGGDPGCSRVGSSTLRSDWYVPRMRPLRRLRSKPPDSGRSRSLRNRKSLITRTMAASAAVCGFLGLCIVAAQAFAADEEAQVLILNGLDPYLPAYMAIDSAMRASLAKDTTNRIVLYSEPLDAQRF